MSNGVQSTNQNNGASNFTQVTYDPTNRPTLFNRRLDGVQLIIATMSVVAFIVTVALVITILAVGLDHPTSDKTLVFSDNQYCSKLGKDLLINDIGNIFDAGVLLALCRAMTSPKTSGLLGGGVAMLTNMRTNVNDGLFWEFLPERPRGNRNLSEEQRKNLRFIPGTIKGLHHMSIRGKLTFPRILEFLYQFGEPTAVGTLSQDTKSILRMDGNFKNNCRDGMFHSLYFNFSISNLPNNHLHYDPLSTDKRKRIKQAEPQIFLSKISQKTTKDRRSMSPLLLSFDRSKSTQT